MKTKEEILDSIIGNIRAENKQEIWYDDAIKAMEEYALQFKPKKKSILKEKVNVNGKLEKTLFKCIHETIYTFPTKNKEGFIQEEINRLLKHFPDTNINKFNEALMGITCLNINNELIIYHCDIETALHCGIENRNINSLEFD